MASDQIGSVLLCGAYTSYTPAGKKLFVKAERQSTIPHRGDIVYFYSQDMGRVCHVGIVETVKKIGSKYHITTLEGNTSGVAYDRNGGEYARKSYTFTIADVGGKNRINGFGTPKFGADTCSVEEFLTVATEQLGYIEKAHASANLEDKKADPGNKNFTKYGKWYGMNGEPWCQMAVSWIAMEACKRHAEKRKDGWKLHDDNTWHFYENGVMQKDGWIEIDGKWYWLDKDGNMQINWLMDNGHWYFMFGDGHMAAREWVWQNGEWYYMHSDGKMAAQEQVSQKNKFYYIKENGMMAKNSLIKSKQGICYVDENGVWNNTYVDFVK